MSEVGLAMLFDRSGGQITPRMRDLITNKEVKSAYLQELLDEIRAKWDEWDSREDNQKVRKKMSK